MADQTPEKLTGDPRWDAVLARLGRKRPRRRPGRPQRSKTNRRAALESARSDSPSG